MTAAGEIEGQDVQRGTLSIAVAQPACVASDPAANARTHADLVRRAASRVVVFPEMSLTGYELQAPVVDLDDELWRPLVQACAQRGAVALVGAPVADGSGAEFIATVAVSGEGVRVAYRKAWPGSEEAARFSPGPGPAVVQVDGWRIGLGICRDTGVAEHVEATAALGVDVFAAGLADVPEDSAVQRERAERIARACRAHVAFASFAGPTGRGYERTAGGSAVYSPAGSVLAGCGSGTGEIATAVIG
ncbi:putative amidohydrolase [Kineococcus radiotolerans]|uniref:Putative amidohydrolase n=1 Tax=Kineococcus radiotolerans TaxID=131568 RepID=A0A7W4XV49_KINRA|nr:carbon-nitrogen hydrolase family protein [Kineococcus radiotolerans]MBB2899418.1 putative amidohydrolase [Kineococcus radiotolerans]